VNLAGRSGLLWLRSRRTPTRATRDFLSSKLPPRAICIIDFENDHLCGQHARFVGPLLEVQRNLLDWLRRIGVDSVS